MTPKDLGDVLAIIEAGAGDVRTAGNKLAERIKRFEAWLNKLPGRIQTETEMGSSPQGEWSTYLAFGKEGKEWVLYTYTYHHQNDEYSDRILLRDSSLETKACAVRYFPNLLLAMAESQKKMVKNLHEASVEFDRFAEDAGIQEGK